MANPVAYSRLFNGGKLGTCLEYVCPPCGDELKAEGAQPYLEPRTADQLDTIYNGYHGMNITRMACARCDAPIIIKETQDA